MTDVAIHRCVLRIRRTSGWTWGADPRALLEAARRALPDLIAARLPALADEIAAPVHVREPVRIRIETTARELAALADPFSAATTMLRARIADAAAAAVAQALEHAPRATVAPPTSATDRGAASRDGDVAGRAATSDPDRLPSPETAADAAAAAMLRALRAWWRSGAIADVLTRIDDAAVAALHAQVLGAESAGVTAAASLLAVAQTTLATLRAMPRSVDSVRQRIAIIAALVEAVPTASIAQLRAAIDAVLPLAAVAPSATTTTAVANEPAVAVGRATAREIEIRSVLPFLMLPALHHAGWLDTAATLLASHEVETVAFALGAGLAAKVLDPLERGWSRSRADRLVIAAFCGTDEPIADAEIAAAAVRIRPILPALDVALRAVLARARRSTPLVLWRDGRGWSLLDTDGMVVLAAHAELRPVLATAPSEPIIVPAAVADHATLEQIDLANARFVSDAPRGRDETWRRFAGIERAMITNDTATPVPRLVAITAGLDAMLALAEELAGVLAERPALPRDPVTAFEATCTLAATAALADLGARLFPAEATTPVLALTRFRDLDARVRFLPDRVVVRVPLGRRYADLMRHGVLGELARVPWLGGRTLDLGGA